MAITPLLYQYRLSVEEIVLILYSINCASTAKVLLERAYGEVPDEQLSTLLTAARNSLMARNLAHLVDHNFPQIIPELQKTVFPLSEFTTLIELYDERQEGGFFLQLFHHPKYGFTLQQNQNHIIFDLTYAATPQILGKLLGELFDHVGGEKTIPSLEGKLLNLSFEELQGWMGGEEAEIKAGLEAKHWPDDHAGLLAASLAHMVGFGSISISPLDFEGFIKTDSYPLKHMIAYLESENNCWVFDFKKGLEKPREISCVTRKEFQDLLSAIKI